MSIEEEIAYTKSIGGDCMRIKLGELLNLRDERDRYRQALEKILAIDEKWSKHGMSNGSMYICREALTPTAPDAKGGENE